MKNRTPFLWLLLFCAGLLACDDESTEISQTASLKVVHAVTEAPEIYVNYFNEDITFANFTTLPFGNTARYTLPAGETTSIEVTYVGDTTRQVFEQQVTLEAAQISTLYLVGDSANVSSVFIEDVGLRTLKDSLNAIRFINLSEDVGAVHVGLADSALVIAADLAFSSATGFIDFDATLDNVRYTFTFKDNADSVLASFSYEQFFVFPFPGADPFVISLYDNVTLALVGQADDGEGNSTLRVIRVDHF